MKKANRAAVMHLLAARGSVGKEEPVPTGHHQLRDLEVTFRLPAICSVDRANGTIGGGLNKGKPELLQVTQDVLLRMLKVICETHKLTGAAMVPLWEAAFLASMVNLPLEPPAEAMKARDLVQKKFPPKAPRPIKTMAKNTRADESGDDARCAGFYQGPPRKPAANREQKERAPEPYDYDLDQGAQLDEFERDDDYRIPENDPAPCHPSCRRGDEETDR